MVEYPSSGGGFKKDFACGCELLRDAYNVSGGGS